MDLISTLRYAAKKKKKKDEAEQAQEAEDASSDGNAPAEGEGGPEEPTKAEGTKADGAT